MKPYPNFFYLGLFFVLIYHHPVFGCDEWQKTYETSYAAICYSDNKELYSFTSAIKRGFSIFSDNPEKNQSLTKERVDMIVDRVLRILDMFPPDLHFSIYLHPTHREIERIYLRLGASHVFEKTPIAFYSHKARTIYVSIENITGGVLAHEIAHAVINFHFRTPPPERMQEILAQYVDEHLWEE